MSSDHIIDVSEADFEYEVLSYSLNTPVIVDFWATWCRPCKALDPILEKLVNEANGAFRLARVNVDENPNLVLHYGVRTIPTVKAITQGQVVAEFADLQPENRIRDFLSKILPPSPLNLAIEKGISLLELHQWEEAKVIFEDILQKHAQHPAALLGIAKILLATGNPRDALLLLSDFPESRQYAVAQILKPLAKVMVEYEREILPQDQDRDSFFINCIRLVSRQNFPAALDGLLDILKENRSYKSGLARDVFLAILELMGANHPLTRKYRAELASTLF